MLKKLLVRLISISVNCETKPLKRHFSLAELNMKLRNEFWETLIEQL